MSDTFAKVLNDRPLTGNEFIERCIDLANSHESGGTWRNRTPHHWLSGLVEEVGELAQAIDGEHEHNPQYELMQVVSCAWNMFRHFYATDRKQSHTPDEPKT